MKRETKTKSVRDELIRQKETMNLPGILERIEKIEAKVKKLEEAKK